jgi:hypothetical protein
MAKGAHEIRTMLKQDVETFASYQDVQKRLDEFYMSRIGIRMASRTSSANSHYASLEHDIFSSLGSI